MKTLTTNETVAPVLHYRTPVAILLLMTTTLNILSLTVPLAAQLIFNRILPAPGSPTLSLVVGGVVILAVMEAAVRLTRGYILLEAERVTSADITRKLFRRIVTSDTEPGPRDSARSLEYFTRIAQVAERHSGRLLVAVAELMFLPVVLVLIFMISPIVGFLFCACLCGGAYLSLRGATALRRHAAMLNRLVERRYRFLLGILSAIHQLKAQAIEEALSRRYEQIQGGIARTSMKTADASNDLLNGVLVTNHAITFTAIVYGAYAINTGEMTLGALSAIILLGGRLIAPVQRAVFILVQARDLCDAEDVLAQVMSHPVGRTDSTELQIDNIGQMEMSGVALHAEGLEGGVLHDVSLSLRPGEMVSIGGPSKAASTRLLRIIAGLSPPEDGKVLLNGAPLATFSIDQLHRSVAYVGGSPIMFAGTIRENITRFGDVSFEQAWSVAKLLGVDVALNELPRGLDTPLTGNASETIPASLCQQLSILRALVLRPRLILLDHVDRGLDRQSYSNLQRFIATIRGQATIVIVSDDRNLTAGAERHLQITATGLRPDPSRAERDIATYRTLKL